MFDTHIRVFLELIKKSFAGGVNLYNTVKVYFIFIYLYFMPVSVYVCVHEGAQRSQKRKSDLLENMFLTVVIYLTTVVGTELESSPKATSAAY